MIIFELISAPPPSLIPMHIIDSWV